MRAVGAGSSLSFGIGRNGSGWAWGDNTYGQVGNGATTPVLTAVEIFPAPTFNGCDLSRVAPGVVTIPAEGGSQTFTVGIAPMCTWAVTSNSAFAHPGAGRTGSGTIVVTFDVNPGPQRVATLTFPGVPDGHDPDCATVYDPATNACKPDEAWQMAMRWTWERLLRPVILPETPSEVAASLGIGVAASVLTGAQEQASSRPGCPRP